MKRRIFVLSRIIIICWFLGIIGILCFDPKEISAETSPAKVKILITADQVEFDSQKEVAVYTGNVTVKEDKTTLQADRIEVYLREKGKDIESIKAYSNIKIVREDKIITAEEGIYYHRERKIILTGNPTTRQGQSWIRGDKIVYFWDLGKALVEGNVKAVIDLEVEGKKDSGQ